MRSPTAAFLFSVGAALVVGPTALQADPPPASAEQKVLDRFVGTWKTTFTAPKAEWTPEPRTGTAKVSAERVLGGAFVQEKHANGDGTSGLAVRTYDAGRKAYRGWAFFSNGQSQESVGVWDERTRTFTWTAADPSNTSTLVQRFADADTFDWDLVVKGAEGKVLFRMEGKSTRAKVAKE